MASRTSFSDRNRRCLSTFSIHAIEAFDKRILVWFTRLNILNRHPGIFYLPRKTLDQKLRAIVRLQHLWQSTLPLHLVNYAPSRSGVIEVSIAVRIAFRLKSSVTLNVRKRQPFNNASEAICRPHSIGMHGYIQFSIVPLGQSSSGCVS